MSKTGTMMCAVAVLSSSLMANTQATQEWTPASAKIRHVDPVYPTDALRANQSGIVVAEVSVNRAGDVENVRIAVRSTPAFDEASVVALRQWRFTPLRRNDETVSFTYPVVVLFETEETANASANDRIAQRFPALAEAVRIANRYQVILEGVTVKAP